MLVTNQTRLLIELSEIGGSAAFEFLVFQYHLYCLADPAHRH